MKEGSGSRGEAGWWEYQIPNANVDLLKLLLSVCSVVVVVCFYRLQMKNRKICEFIGKS